MAEMALIDYRHPVDGYANRDQTGTFGSAMHANGIVGRIVTFLKRGRLRIPNITLAYLKAIASQHNRSARFYSGMPEGEQYVIIASSMYQYKNEVELARMIKDKYPGSKVGFIGAFASMQPQLFTAVADFIIIGETEVPFRRFCQGEIELVGKIDLKQEVDVKTLPFPDWAGVSINELGYFPALLKKPFLPIQASRGCPFNCEFCPYLVIQKPPLRRRRNANIIAEIYYLLERYQLRSMLFRDITFSLHKRETKELCRIIAAEKLGIEIGCETRLDCVDDELVDLMAEAGFRSVNVGIESPEEEIVHKSGRKPIAARHTERMVERLEKSGIRVQAFYILGLIGDTEESIRRTISYSQALNTFSAQYCLFTPFPGTKTMEKMKDRLLTTDFTRFTEYDPVVRIDGIAPEQLISLRDEAYNRYYSRYEWLRKHGIGFVGKMVAATWSTRFRLIYSSITRGAKWPVTKEC